MREQPQELHFVNYPVQTSINSSVVTWTGSVICRKLFNEDDEFGDLIVEIPPRDWGLLDIVVTEQLPRCKGENEVKRVPSATTDAYILRNNSILSPLIRKHSLSQFADRA